MSLQSAFSSLINSPPPQVAVEVSSGFVAAARVGKAGEPLNCLRPLPSGALSPSPAQPNVLDAEALTTALRAALEMVGGAGKEVCCLVPDVTARLVLLDFETIPPKRDDLLALVRFRLRKTLPFDADGAAVSAQVFSNGVTRRVLATVADRQRLDEYEDCLERAGARAALLWPAALGYLRWMDTAMTPHLLLRAAAESLTSVIADQHQVSFYRAFSHSSTHALRLEDLFPSVAFYQDLLTGNDGWSASGQATIVCCGLAPQLLQELRQECDWAQIEDAAALLPASRGDADRLLGVRGALLPLRQIAHGGLSA